MEKAEGWSDYDMMESCIRLVYRFIMTTPIGVLGIVQLGGMRRYQNRCKTRAYADHAVVFHTRHRSERKYLDRNCPSWLYFYD